MTIKEENGKFAVYSADGSCLSGIYETRQEAEAVQKAQVPQKKQVDMAELKNIADMTDEEIDEYAKVIWQKMADAIREREAKKG